MCLGTHPHARVRRIVSSRSPPAPVLVQNHAVILLSSLSTFVTPFVRKRAFIFFSVSYLICLILEPTDSCLRIASPPTINEHLLTRFNVCSRPFRRWSATTEWKRSFRGSLGGFFPLHCGHITHFKLICNVYISFRTPFFAVYVDLIYLFLAVSGFRCTWAFL